MTDQPDTTAPSAGDEHWLEVSSSRHFAGWLGEQRVSLAFSTYQAGKLFLVGRNPDGQISVFERTFSRCMGLWADGQTLWMSSVYQLWRFENALRSGMLHNQYDRLYIPRLGYTTGDLDIHDVAVESSGRVVFINTLFGCIATTSLTDSFAPIWQPPFLSKLAAEDRCHLNGLALENGKIRYVTACSASDIVDGWRNHRAAGGIIMDVRSNEIVASGLSMPHSPRIYRDTLYLHNSGTGFFGSVDIASGKFRPITFCPGYLRGLTFAGDYAIAGISRPRKEKTFTGLELDDALIARKAEAWCGLLVIDLRTGDVVHWLRLEGLVTELYDVVTLPNVTRPMAMGFKTDEIQRTLSIGEPVAM